MQFQIPTQTHQEVIIQNFNICEDLQFNAQKQEFETQTLPRILIVAKSQGGKSWLIKELLFQLKKFIPSGVIVSPTNKENKFYSKIFPESFIYDVCTEEQIQLFLQVQNAQTALREMHKKNFNRTFLFIMDDCAYNKKFMESEGFRQILFNSRHYHIIFIFSTQSISEIPMTARQNFSHILLLNNDSVSNIQMFQKSFAANLQLNEFRELYSLAIKDYGCLVIKNNIAQSNLKNKYAKFFRFRSRNWNEVTSPEETNFVIGSRGFWKQHYQKYDPNKQIREAIEFIGKNALPPNKKKKAVPKDTTINFLFKENEKEEKQQQ